MFKWFLGSDKDKAGGDDLLVADKQTGQAFLPQEVELDESPNALIRNGVGTRKRFGIPVYDMAVYLSEKTQDAQTAITMPGAKQIRLVALRNIKGDVLASAFLNGVKANSPADVRSMYIKELGQIIKIFKGQDSVAKNHTFHIDLLPNEGAFFYINEELQGKVLHIPGFNEAILGIWLGESPADADLKSNLLLG